MCRGRAPPFDCAQGKLSAPRHVAARDIRGRGMAALPRWDRHNLLANLGNRSHKNV